MEAMDKEETKEDSEKETGDAIDSTETKVVLMKELWRRKTHQLEQVQIQKRTEETQIKEF